MFCWVETTDKLLFMSNNLIIYDLIIQIIIMHIYAIIVNYWIFSLLIVLIIVIYYFHWLFIIIV